jgi:hypothetical protein
MKQLPVILLIIFLLLGVYLVHEYVAAMAPAWQVEAAANALVNTQLHAVEASEAAKRAVWFTDFYRVLFTGLLVVAVGGTGVYAWKVIDERTESKNRMVDGSFALSTFKNAQGQIWTVDPNKSQFGAIGFDKSSGQLITDVALVGPDRQLDYAKSVQKTRTASAVTSGADGVRNSAQAKLAAGYYDRPDRQDYRVVQDELEQLTVAPWQPLTLADAFNQSTNKSWILGQSATGELCKFNVFSTIHTGLLGATNTGKTESTALLMAINARKHGMHVIALDGAEGIDWKPYNNVFEVYQTDYKLIGDQLEQIVKLYNQRMSANRLAEVETIYQLDYVMPSLFVILEEFGKTMQAFKRREPKQYELIEGELSELMRTSRKAGIYFLLMDQSMAGWSPELKPNVKDYIAYHLGGRQGSAFDAYKLHELRDVGQFWNRDKVYDAWHTKAEADTLIKQLPARKVLMLTDSQAVTTVTDNRDGGYINGKNTANDTPLIVTSKSDNTRVTTDKTGNNEGDNDNAVTSNVTSNDNAVTTSVTTPLSLSGPAVTTKEKQEVYRIYQSLGKRKNATAKIIWGNAGGYLRYLNAVIAEYEGGETLQ